MKDDDRPAVLWELPEPRPAALPSPLSRPDIVAAGIRLADDGGLSEVSMRKVAGVLGAGPMRLYRFVPSKEDLLALMVDRVFGEIAGELVERASWRSSLHAVALGYRAASFRHDWFVDLLGGRPHVGPNSLAVLESTAAAISGAPRRFTASELWSALGAVNAYLFGAIRADIVDLRPGEAGRIGAKGDEDRDYLRRRLESDDYPALRRLADEADRPDLEKDFLWGLDLVLDGLTT